MASPRSLHSTQYMRLRAGFNRSRNGPSSRIIRVALKFCKLEASIAGRNSRPSSGVGALQLGTRPSPAYHRRSSSPEFNL